MAGDGEKEVKRSRHGRRIKVRFKGGRERGREGGRKRKS